MEKKLSDDLVRGLGIPSEYTGSSDEEELLNEHREFVNKYVLTTDAIPDENPGENIFHLDVSGKIFSHRSLDLRNCNLRLEIPEENLIFSCGTENQLLLATTGYLGHFYRFKDCPVVLMKWMFQMSSVHPSYVVSVKLLNTLMEITCDSTRWTPSLLDVATVFANMGIDFQALFPLPQLQPNFTSSDLISVVPASSISDQGRTSCPIFIQIPLMNLTHVLKFLGFCAALNKEIYDDHERFLLVLMLLKIYLEQGLRHTSVVDLHEFVKNLLENINEWDTKVGELCLAISQLSNHHHDYLKLVQLVPTSSAYYLVFSLLTLISETCLLKLCMALEKHVKCDIRENPSLFYRTKVI
uniref:Coiled-coil SMC6 And NSE5 INteracting (CANIN) domain-containing protein n=1 Tax=Leptobrachium leishanense TaxID=445787 RepID=A0A8C5R399_9ANUR